MGIFSTIKDKVKQGLSFVGQEFKRGTELLSPHTPEGRKRLETITFAAPTMGLKNVAAPVGKAIANVAAKEVRVLAEAGFARMEALKSSVKNVIGNLDDIVKVRKAGNGTLKITRAELEVMKQMGDLKPTIGERYLQNPIRVFEELGEGAKELFYRPVKVAESIAIESKNLWNKEFDSVIKGLDKKTSERIMKFAVSQEVGGEKILAGTKAPILTPKENTVYGYVRGRYDSLLDELNEARAIVGKTPINKVKNYFTHIRDLSTLEQMGFNPVTDDIETLLANKVHRNTTAFQWAKKRTGALTDVEMDAFNVFRKYQERAIDHIKLTPAIAKVRELSMTIIPEEAGKFKLQDVAPNAFKYISEWTDFVVGQKVQSPMPKVSENLLATLNKNMAFATLAFNVRSAAIQPSAIRNTVVAIGPKNTGVGIKELLRGQGRFALENSKVLQGRQFETAIQDMAATAYGKIARARAAIAEAGIKPLQLLDSLTAQATWLGAYNDAITRLGKSGQVAYNYADDIVTKTQASAARSDIAKIQRSTMGRAATQFQTFVINDFNFLFRDVLGVGSKQKLNQSDIIKKGVTYVTVAMLWNWLSEDVLGIPSPFPRPIKALQKKNGLLEAGKELAGQVPVIGGVARYGSGLFGAALDTITQGFNKVSGKYTAQSWWEIAGKLFGIPGTVQLKKTIKAVDVMDGGYTVTTDKGKKIKIYFTDPIDKVRALLFGPYESKKAKETRESGASPDKRKYKLTPP